MREILEDLPGLLKENPLGVTLRNLHAWYGEPHDKLAKTIKEMAELHLVDLMRGPANTMLVFPRGKGAKAENVKLTLLQSNLLKILKDAYNQKKDLLHTNYARLAQCSGAAYGTVRTAVQRLQELGLIKVEGESERGRQDKLVIRVITEEPRHENNVVRINQVSRRVPRSKFATQ